MMLGFHLYIVGAVMLLGIVCLVFSRNWQRLVRLGALFSIMIAAFLIPTSTRVQNPFFALTFQVLLVFTVVLLMGSMLKAESVVLANRTGQAALGWRSLLAHGYRIHWATLACLVAALVGAAASLPLRPVYGRRSDPVMAARHDMHVGIVNCIRQQMKPNQKPLVFVTTLSHGVNGSILAWHARKAGMSCTFDDDCWSDDLERQQRRFDAANFVVTSVATTDQGKEWVEVHPSGKVARDLDRMIRARQDFAEVGSFSFMGAVTYSLFARKGLFDGWKDKEGLCPEEGPYPQWNLPIVRWGVGHDTRLEFECKKDTPMHLLISGRPGVPNQVLTVFLDGERIREYTFPSNGASFMDLDISMRASSGVHELTLHYAACYSGSGAKAAVLFKQLQIVPDSNAAIGQAGEQE